MEATEASVRAVMFPLVTTDAMIRQVRAEDTRRKLIRGCRTPYPMVTSERKPEPLVIHDVEWSARKP